MTNMSGAMQRKVHELVAQTLAGLSGDEGTRLLKNLPEFSDGVGKMVKRLTAEPRRRFSKISSYQLSDGNTISAFTLARKVRLSRILVSLLDARYDTDMKTLCKLYLERGHTVTREQFFDWYYGPDYRRRRLEGEKGYTNYFLTSDHEATRVDLASIQNTRYSCHDRWSAIHGEEVILSERSVLLMLNVDITKVEVEL